MRRAGAYRQKSRHRKPYGSPEPARRGLLGSVIIPTRCPERESNPRSALMLDSHRRDDRSFPRRVVRRRIQSRACSGCPRDEVPWQGRSPRQAGSQGPTSAFPPWACIRRTDRRFAVKRDFSSHDPRSIRLRGRRGRFGGAAAAAGCGQQPGEHEDSRNMKATRHDAIISNPCTS